MYSNIIRYACYLSLLFIHSEILSQTTNNIRNQTDVYRSLRFETSYPNVLKIVSAANLLDLHLFNISYAQGIDDFIEFKGAFHYAVGKSDIPPRTSPVEYLLDVIKKYQFKNSYRV